MRFAKPDVLIERRGDGSLLLRSAQPLKPYGRAVGDWLVHWAATAPDRVFLAERPTSEGPRRGHGDGDAWRTLTYGDALAQVRRVGEALLARGLTAETPVAILSGNSIRHALVSLGTMHAGIPVAPISPAYSLVSKDFAKLRTVIETLRPGLVFTDDRDACGPAHRSIGHQATPFSELLSHPPSSRIDAAFARITPDTIAKILFTSGSTGTPKGAINTHRALRVSQQSMAQLWPVVEQVPVVMCDWLPWHHTVGGNAGFNLVLRNGGTLYIDDGRPTAEGMDATARNLTAIEPTISFNVPRGYELLVPRLETDAALRRAFFLRLELIYNTGASMSAPIWHRLKALVAREHSSATLVAGWGSTEMTLGTRVHYETDTPENVGTPGPGLEIKLVPSGGKLEARVRGPNVMPGYYRAPDLTREAFDKEGFLKSGDALALADPDDPSKGLVFDGRLAENFKLSSGTWVNVGAVRLAVIAACQPLVQDAVIAGENRDELGALLFLDRAAVGALGLDAAGVRARLADALMTLRLQATGSGSAPTRLMILDEPPSLDAGEITDKGYINQRVVLDRRRQSVEALYRSREVICSSESG